MRSFWTEPFLWIHLTGLAVVPLTLELVWVGLAMGDPLFPVWLELVLVGAIGLVPVLWMQWTRPFDIFSLLILAIAPAQLTEAQRRLLSLFKTKPNQSLTLVAAVLMLGLLWQIYRVAPLATGIVPVLPQWHLLGLVIAGLAFLASHLFLQIPLSVAQVLFTSESEWSRTLPYPLEKITEDFTIPGVRVNRLIVTQAPDPVQPD